MLITATFQGSSGSLGYVKCKSYLLFVRPAGGMTVRRVDGSGVCPYSSLSAFLRNWTNIAQHQA